MSDTQGAEVSAIIWTQPQYVFLGDRAGRFFAMEWNRWLTVAFSLSEDTLAPVGLFFAGIFDSSNESWLAAEWNTSMSSALVSDGDDACDGRPSNFSESDGEGTVPVQIYNPCANPHPGPALQPSSISLLSSFHSTGRSRSSVGDPELSVGRWKASAPRPDFGGRTVAVDGGVQ
jgi:hypothetical protein